MVNGRTTKTVRASSPLMIQLGSLRFLLGKLYEGFYPLCILKANLSSAAASMPTEKNKKTKVKYRAV